MENKKYKVCRDNIYVGELVKTDNIYRCEVEDRIFYTIPEHLEVGSWKSYRSILFGWEEVKPEDYTYYEGGFEIIDSKKLKKRIKQERHIQKAGCRSFRGIPGEVLPREYWDILDDKGDDYRRGIDAFVPHKEEGPIKKLKRF